MHDSFRASDGTTLEAEWSDADSPVAGAVLCHPHPQYGGTMRSIVVSALFEALPSAGVTCLRFNFRGVEGSSGAHDDGDGEQLDAAAAVAALAERLDDTAPLVLMGWSFGADIALSVTAPKIAGWLAVAPPLRCASPERAGGDSRPKRLVLAEHDEVRDASEVQGVVTDWPATIVEVIGGASHFFVGRTDRVTAAALAFVASV